MANEGEKKCPKCPDHPVMKTTPYGYIIPAQNETRFGSRAKPISDTSGLPLAAHVCPNCHLVEFYYSDLT